MNIINDKPTELRRRRFHSVEEIQFVLHKVHRKALETSQERARDQATEIKLDQQRNRKEQLVSLQRALLGKLSLTAIV